MALLLVVQLLCAMSSAFSSEAADDVHHSYQAEPEVSLAVSNLVDLPDNAVVEKNNHHGCDHCSHCHAAHIGLFKPATALPALQNEKPTFYINRIPNSPQGNIYRPPIA